MGFRLGGREFDGVEPVVVLAEGAPLTGPPEGGLDLAASRVEVVEVADATRAEAVAAVHAVLPATLAVVTPAEVAACGAVTCTSDDPVEHTVAVVVHGARLLRTTRPVEVGRVAGALGAVLRSRHDLGLAWPLGTGSTARERTGRG